jgi:hypothetical protein
VDGALLRSTTASVMGARDMLGHAAIAEVVEVELSRAR